MYVMSICMMYAQAQHTNTHTHMYNSIFGANLVNT